MSGVSGWRNVLRVLHTHLIPSNFQHVQLCRKQYSIENLRGLSSQGPVVKLARILRDLYAICPDVP
jgi:hypothetical protein